MALSDFTAAVAKATASIDAFAKKSEAGAVAATGFAKLLQDISGFQTFGGVSTKAGGGPVTIGDLLKNLATVIEAQKEFYRSGGQGFNKTVNPQVYEDSIRKIVELIHTWGGPAADNFTRSGFEQWLENGGGTTAPGPSAVKPTPTSAGAGAWLPGAPVVIDPLIAQQAELDRLTAAALNYKGVVDAAAQTLTETNDRLTALRTAAGVDAKDNAVAGLNTELKELQSTLQYLQDTNDEKGKNDKRIADQTKLIADDRKALDEAQKAQRISEYEFLHSDAYKAQVAAMEAAKADLAAKQKEYDAETVTIAEKKKALDTATTKAADATTKAATDLTHSTDILRTTGADFVVTINKAGGQMGAMIGRAVTLIGTAADDAAKKITTAGASMGAMASRGLLP